MIVAAAVDGSSDSKHLVAEAAELADALRRELHVVHVMEKSDMKQGTGDVEGPDTRSIKQQAEDLAADTASEISANFTPIGLIGKPAREIVTYTENHDIDYLIIGGKQQSPVGKAVFGSTTQQILLNTDCNVITVN
ncbi:universal stress protein [Halalkalicoccus sp. NIPERK01]|uniref:universal stress protein n=1 Tax=Halalkalicoccus sp. NIPERK01 TaxID=3053469 RepID=UPI00256E9A76|nr:universal stress protein [Halalkalicoccus sp. NIPERK01]MDL5363829.1 universal stress protein [Halalkalicoccus sp. NIPERK01]